MKNFKKKDFKFHVFAFSSKYNLHQSVSCKLADYVNDNIFELLIDQVREIAVLTNENR